MIDPPSSISPLLAEGPREPSLSLRPAVSEQRILLLDGAVPEMLDLATGNIRRWENGPPVSVPCVSAPFTLSAYQRLQVQVLRDPRPTSQDLTLLSIGSGGRSIDVVERGGGRLAISAEGETSEGPIGQSSAIVVGIEPDRETNRVFVTARNAESMEVLELTTTLPADTATLTIGGPTTQLTGRYGRRRLIPVHLDVARPAEPVDQLRRVVRGARRVASDLRSRGPQ